MNIAEIAFSVIVVIVLAIAFRGIYLTFKNSEIEEKATEFDSIVEWLEKHNVYVNWHPHYNEPDKKVHEKTFVLRRKWVDSDRDVVVNECEGICFKDFYDTLRKIRIVEKTEFDPIRVRDMLSCISARSQILKKNSPNFWKG
ncbi:hypothetical protein OFDDKENP_00159 [Aeromonas phage B614]|nr:hypothetical protein OFDDKENP_00159 [Aeromonas phage B614]UYD58113.1 hypothetical protein JNEOFJEA_00016 [Aeromonas phage UP87]UYD58477.1 hypothetical protein IPAKJDPM_00134 [Aeromonas phage avDM14-QBC]UYD58693.1 hypothetical protein HNNIDBEH_00100 [Aeromonas phage avDM10-HWA]UYD59004.1 hypothetical protein OFOPOMKI_00154 [Aeromonas phage avDM7-IJDJ]UYD59816.1 hypothetical protein LEHPIFIF_00043 [Aeromonas phage avDM9-HANS]